MRKLLLTGLALTASLSAHAGGGGVNPLAANLPEQIVQESTLVEQYTAQAMQVQYQLQMMQNMLNNARSLSPATVMMLSGYVNQVASLYGQARGIAYAGQNTLGGIQAQYGTNTVLSNYGDQMRQLNDNLDQQTVAVLNGYNISAQAIQNEQSAQATIDGEVQAAMGSPAEQQKLLSGSYGVLELILQELQMMHNDLNASNQELISLQRARMSDQQHSGDPADRYWQAVRERATQ